MNELLLPLQGAPTNRVKTQGVALGYKQVALSGRTCGVLRLGYAIEKNKLFLLHISKLNRNFAPTKTISMVLIG